jgi:ribosomal protein L31
VDDFHKYGIKRCDNFIMANSPLKGNWNYFMSKHAGGIDGKSTEVSVIRIWGDGADTVKVSDSYIQTRAACYLHRRTTLTYKGACEENIDLDIWTMSHPLAGRDYKVYTNKGGVDMFAKEVTVGEAKLCIQETEIRKKGRRD